MAQYAEFDDRSEEHDHELHEVCSNPEDNKEDQMLMEDKVFLTIDILLRLCTDPSMKLRAIKPEIQGLEESESDYD